MSYLCASSMLCAILIGKAYMGLGRIPLQPKLPLGIDSVDLTTPRLGFEPKTSVGDITALKAAAIGLSATSATILLELEEILLCGFLLVLMMRSFLVCSLLAYCGF